VRPLGRRHQFFHHLVAQVPAEGGTDLIPLAKPFEFGGGPQKLDRVLSCMSESPEGGTDHGKNQKKAQSTV
jgi:hypothetical protein